MATKSLYFDLIGRDRSATAALDKVGKQLLVFGAAAAAGVAVAVTKFADWDAQMSQVQTLSHATSAEMGTLRTAALEMGQGIGFSATQVADAETELVKAGVSVKDILGGALTGALNLAAAGQIDVAQATEIASIALTQFKLTGKDVPHVADLLAAGADKALGGVEDLGEALKSGGLVAAQFGVSLDETVGTLSAFANAGLLGETAGTDLRQMLLKLSNPSAEAAKTMKQLGIEIYDSSGKFVGMAGLAGQLKDKMSQLDPATRNAAMATIFGAKAIAGANVLYEQGAKGIDKWTREVNDSGFAAEQAAGKMDNLKGDVSKLGAAIDTDLIKAGSGANGLLREFTQTATNLVKTVGEIPQPILNVGLGLTAVVGGAALAGGAFITLIPKIEATRAALTRLNAEFALSSKGASMLSVGLRIVPWVAVGVEVAHFTSGLVDAAREAMGLSHSVDDLRARFAKGLDTKTVDDQLNASVLGIKTNVNQLAQLTNSGWAAGFLKNMADSVNSTAKWNPVLRTLAGGVGDVSDRIGKLDQSMADMVSSGNAKQAAQVWDYLKSKTDGSKEAISNLVKWFPQYSAAAKTAGDANEQAAGPTAKNAAAIAKLSGTAQTAGGDIDDLANKIRDFGKGQLDVNATQRDFQAAIDSVTTTLQGQQKAYEDAHGSLDGWSASLDIGTQEGRDNQAALDGIASSALAAAGAILTQTGSQEDATAAVQQGRDALIQALAQFGITGQAAQDYADRLGLIPGNVNTAVGLTGIPAAQAQFDAFVTRNDGRVVHMNVDVTGRGTAFVPGLGNVAFAAGGDLDAAPGPKGVDSMFFKGAKGEHVLTAGDVDAMGGQQAVYAFRKRLHAGVSSKLAALTQVPDVQPAQLAFMPALDNQPAPATPAGPTRVEVSVVQKVGGVRLDDLIDMRIKANGEWQALELSSGVGR